MLLDESVRDQNDQKNIQNASYAGHSDVFGRFYVESVNNNLDLNEENLESTWDDLETLRYVEQLYNDVDVLDSSFPIFQ